jgi:spore germination protein GerM
VAAVDIYSYDARDERLIRMAVEVEDTTLATILRQLQAPARQSGLPAGNPLDDADVIRAVEVSRGRAVVDLAEEFNEISGSAQLIALAEIVYTATGRPGIGQVTFTLEGSPIETPRGDGSLTSEPLTRSDYQRLSPGG